MTDSASLAAPAYDSIDKRRLDLIRKTVAKGATDAELASFLELAKKYDLDPFAHEVWCAISQRDGGNRNVLIMVGRAGLRKIAQRQGLKLDGDIVRENDEFIVTRNGDRTREIVHKYQDGSVWQSGMTVGQERPELVRRGRGPILGAWCEVVGKDSYGYFYAPLSEYKPTNPKKLQYSPWGSQESTMILAAAERQAIAMATPLGGLHAEGETPALDGGTVPALEAAPVLAPQAQAIVDRANLIGYRGTYADAQTVDMTWQGLSSDAEREDWAANATADLDTFAAEQENRDQ